MRLDPPFQGCLQLGEFPVASVPRANSVRVCASLSPWMIALIMLCPLLPHTSHDLRNEVEGTAVDL
jgi:hypothetical protein